MHPRRAQAAALTAPGAPAGTPASSSRCAHMRGLSTNSSSSCRSEHHGAVWQLGLWTPCSVSLPPRRIGIPNISWCSVISPDMARCMTVQGCKADGLVVLLPLTLHIGEGLTLMHIILSGRWRSAEWACASGPRQRPRNSSSALTDSIAGRQPAGKHAWYQLSAGTWRQGQQAIPLDSAAACV